MDQFPHTKWLFRSGWSPDRTGLLDMGGRTYTYGSLDDEIVHRVGTLEAAGITPGVRVGLIGMSGVEHALWSLAVIDCAICCPLNPATPVAESLRILPLMGVDVVLAPGALDGPASRAAAELGIPTVWYDKDGTLDGTKVQSLRGLENRSDDTRLLLHTSGSTGGVKVVRHTIGTMMAGAEASARTYELTPRDRRLNVMPLFHIQGLVGSLLTSLASGSSIALVEVFDPEKIFDQVNASSSSWFSASPAMHRAIVSVRRGKPVEVPSLRFVRSGSGPLTTSSLDELERILRVPVVESYGMTEAHQIASNRPSDAERKRGSVGRSTGSEVGVLCEDGSVATKGSGELVVRGSNVTTGYEVPPARNRTAFLNGGWLRTGDLGFVDDDGRIWVRGRADEVVIRGGEKVSPTEVEAALLSLPGICDALVFPVADPIFGEDIRAAVICDGRWSCGADILVEARRLLTHYKVPRQVHIVSELPRSPSGKVNRRQAAEQLIKQCCVDAGAPAHKVSAGDGAHENDVEIQLQALWSAVLGTKVEPDDDFFALGGDSLSGVRLIDLVEQRFGVSLDPITMYDDASTVKGMARCLERVLARA